MARGGCLASRVWGAQGPVKFCFYEAYRFECVFVCSCAETEAASCRLSAARTTRVRVASADRAADVRAVAESQARSSPSPRAGMLFGLVRGAHNVTCVPAHMLAAHDASVRRRCAHIVLHRCRNHDSETTSAAGAARGGGTQARGGGGHDEGLHVRRTTVPDA